MGLHRQLPSSTDHDDRQQCAHVDAGHHDVCLSLLAKVRGARYAVAHLRGNLVDGYIAWMEDVLERTMFQFLDGLLVAASEVIWDACWTLDY
jgi:hypothetical protein